MIFDNIKQNENNIKIILRLLLSLYEQNSVVQIPNFKCSIRIILQKFNSKSLPHLFLILYCRELFSHSRYRTAILILSTYNFNDFVLTSPRFPVTLITIADMKKLYTHVSFFCTNAVIVAAINVCFSAYLTQWN